MRKKYRNRKRISVRKKRGSRRFLFPVALVFIFVLMVYIRNTEIKKKEIIYNGNIIKAGLREDRTAGRSLSNADLLCDVLVRQLGKPYVYGKDGPDSFDCSGLVEYAYSRAGIKLPRVVSDQGEAGEIIDKSNMKFGDIVFFSDDGTNLTHVGIYVGKGYMVHAPRTGDVVKVSKINSEYYLKNFKRAVRVLPENKS